MNTGIRIATGLLAGIVATAVMSGQMIAAPSTRRIGKPPPQLIADVLLAGHPESERKVAATVIHLGIGASSGVLYRAVFRRRRGGVVSGVFFGIAIWVVGYEVVVPLLGVLPPAHRDSAERRIALIEAHAAYGATLGVLS